MKRFWRLWIFAAFVFVLAMSQPRLWREAIWGKPTSRIVWMNALPAAKARATRENKPLLMVFTADWCGPCQEMTETIWQNGDIVALVNSRFIPVLIDIDLQGKLAQRYSAISIPYVVIQDAQREEIILDASGYYDPSAFLRFGHDALMEAANPKGKRRPVNRAENFPALPPLFGLN